MSGNPLDRQWFYKGFKRRLQNCIGRHHAESIWKEAGEEYDRILAEHPEVKAHKGAIVLPSVVLFRALFAHGQDAEGLLNQYGDEMGARLARIVYGITSIPGISRLLWKRIDRIMIR